jgi:AraC-like DNA-binding protein
MQMPCSVPLSGLVRHYLLLQSEKDIHLNYRLFSDGNPGIVFHLEDSVLQSVGNAERLPRSFIYGQIAQFRDVASVGKMGLLVVVLQPFGVYSLLGIDAAELNNSIIDLADIFGVDAAVLEDKIINAKTVAHRILAIEKFFLEKTAGKKEPDDLFKESLYEIYNSRGTVSIEGMLKKVPVTERQLERKFRQYIGTSPKKYADIIRFQHFLKLLQHRSQGTKISDIVYESGYYDQSHLNGFFKRITGITPNQYKTDHQLLAVNFMQLPKNA